MYRFSKIGGRWGYALNLAGRSYDTFRDPLVSTEGWRERKEAEKWYGFATLAIGFMKDGRPCCRNLG